MEQASPDNLPGSNADRERVGATDGIGRDDNNQTAGLGLAGTGGGDASAVERAKVALQGALDLLNGKQPEPKPAPTPELADVGEKIGGARKDLWAQRGLALSDLEGMTRGEAHQFVTKDNVWPKPDYAKLVEEGVPAEVAAAVKLLRDSLAAKPKTDSDEARKDFIEAMHAARDVLAAVKTVEDVRGIQNKLYESLGLAKDPYGYRLQDDEQKAARRRLFSIFKGRTASFSIDYKMRRKIEQMVAQGWPATKAEGWTRRFDVRLGRSQDGEKWFVTNKQRRIVADGLASKEEAEAKAKELYEALTKNPDGTKKAPERPHLDVLERTGKDIRNGRDVKPEDFLSDFGFRGVEFGNWVANDERQKAVNLAFEGLHDLADTLGIPPETLSLGGQLALAFGARGKGSAAAHYEPGKLVINLTKLSGAGSLAHEWGHALDHYFGQLDSDQGTKGAPDYASGGRNAYNFKALGNLRPELASAFDGVMDALFKREKQRAEMVRDVELRIEQVQANLARLEERLAETPKGNHPSNRSIVKHYTDLISTQRDVVLKGLGERLADLRDEAKPLKPQKVESSFYQNAQALSGKSGAKGYWARPTELFARSFEAYVFDKIKERGNKSQYLVQGVEENRFPAELYGGNPYPTGEERAKIDAAYDKLFQTVDVRGIEAPREGGPTKALFSRAGGPEIGRREFIKGAAAVAGGFMFNGRLYATPRGLTSILSNSTKQAIPAAQAVQWLAENSQNPTYRRVAAKIAPLLDGVKIRSVQFEEIGRAGGGIPLYAGMYHGTDDAFVPNDMSLGTAHGVFLTAPNGEDMIWLAKTSKERELDGWNEATVIHEALHAAVVRYYGELRVRHPNDAAMLKHDGFDREAFPRSAKAVQAVNDIAGIWKDAVALWKKQGEGFTTDPAGDPDGERNMTNRAARISNGLENPDEFIAYALSDENMQGFLKEMSTKNDTRSLWQRLVDAIRSMFGMGTVGRTALDDVLDATNALIDEVRGQQAVPPGRGNRATEGSFKNAAEPPRYDPGYGFYSALERAIAGSGQTKAPAAQWLATLKKVPGVKQEELEWSGIDDLLKMQEGPVTKDMLLDLMRTRGIQVYERELGGDPDPEDIEARVNARIENIVDEKISQLEDRGEGQRSISRRRLTTARAMSFTVLMPIETNAMIPKSRPTKSLSG
jgi:hypothetical protein